MKRLLLMGALKLRGPSNEATSQYTHQQLRKKDVATAMVGTNTTQEIGQISHVPVELSTALVSNSTNMPNPDKFYSQESQPTQRDKTAEVIDSAKTQEGAMAEIIENDALKLKIDQLVGQLQTQNNENSCQELLATIKGHTKAKEYALRSINTLFIPGLGEGDLYSYLVQSFSHERLSPSEKNIVIVYLSLYDINLTGISFYNQDKTDQENVETVLQNGVQELIEYQKQYISLVGFIESENDEDIKSTIFRISNGTDSVKKRALLTTLSRDKDVTGFLESFELGNNIQQVKIVAYANLLSGNEIKTSEQAYQFLADIKSGSKGKEISESEREFYNLVDIFDYAEAEKYLVSNLQNLLLVADKNPQVKYVYEKTFENQISYLLQNNPGSIDSISTVIEGYISYLTDNGKSHMQFMSSLKNLGGTGLTNQLDQLATLFSKKEGESELAIGYTRTEGNYIQPQHIDSAIANATMPASIGGRKELIQSRENILLHLQNNTSFSGQRLFVRDGRSIIASPHYKYAPSISEEQKNGSLLPSQKSSYEKEIGESTDDPRNNTSAIISLVGDGTFITDIAGAMSSEEIMQIRLLLDDPRMDMLRPLNMKIGLGLLDAYQKAPETEKNEYLEILTDYIKQLNENKDSGLNTLNDHETANLLTTAIVESNFIKSASLEGKELQTLTGEQVDLILFSYLGSNSNNIDHIRDFETFANSPILQFLPEGHNIPQDLLSEGEGVSFNQVPLVAKISYVAMLSSNSSEEAISKEIDLTSKILDETIRSNFEEGKTIVGNKKNNSTEYLEQRYKDIKGFGEGLQEQEAIDQLGLFSFLKEVLIQVSGKKLTELLTKNTVTPAAAAAATAATATPMAARRTKQWYKDVAKELLFSRGAAGRALIGGTGHTAGSALQYGAEGLGNLPRVGKYAKPLTKPVGFIGLIGNRGGYIYGAPYVPLMSAYYKNVYEANETGEAKSTEGVTSGVPETSTKGLENRKRAEKAIIGSGDFDHEIKGVKVEREKGVVGGIFSGVFSIFSENNLIERGYNYDMDIFFDGEVIVTTDMEYLESLDDQVDYLKNGGDFSDSDYPDNGPMQIETKAGVKRLVFNKLPELQLTFSKVMQSGYNEKTTDPGKIIGYRLNQGGSPIIELMEGNRDGPDADKASGRIKAKAITEGYKGMFDYFSTPEGYGSIKEAIDEGENRYKDRIRSMKKYCNDNGISYNGVDFGISEITIQNKIGEKDKLSIKINRPNEIKDAPKKNRKKKSGKVLLN